MGKNWGFGSAVSGISLKGKRIQNEIPVLAVLLGAGVPGIGGAGHGEVGISGAVDRLRARLTSYEGREKVRLRRKLAEHPFGTMKRAFNQGYLLLKGLRKVKGEVGFTMLAYNMRRVYQHSWSWNANGFHEGEKEKTSENSLQTRA